MRCGEGERASLHEADGSTEAGKVVGVGLAGKVGSDGRVEGGG